MKKIWIAFVVYLAVRLVIAMQSQNYIDDSSYFVMRQVESIAETGKPIIHDPLNSTDRTFVILPLYYYLLALFNLFLPVIALKIINNIFASFILISIYLLAKRVIKNQEIAFICSVLASLFPIYLKMTIHSLNPLSLAIPLSFFLVYLFLDIEKNLNYIIWITIILIITSAASFIMIIAILIFLFLNYLYQRENGSLDMEYAAFYLTLLLWAIFLLYKNNFQVHGFTILKENLPYLQTIDIYSVLQSLGLIPLSLGIYSIYQYLVRKTNENLTIIISIFFSSSILLSLNMISGELGIIYLSLSMILLFGQFMKDLSSGLEKSKFASRHNLIFYSIIVLVFVLTIPGLMFQEKPYTSSYISGFIWLQNTPPNSTILSIPSDGSLITYFGNRNTVLDTQFAATKDAPIRYNDINEFYRSKFKINALRILDKYDADYFVVSPNQIKQNLSFELKDPCFKIAYKGEIEIYERGCNLDED